MGIVRRTKEQWESIFGAYQSSCFATREYFAKHNIHLKTFSARKSYIDKRSARPTNKLFKVVKSEPGTVSMTPS